MTLNSKMADQKCFRFRKLARYLAENKYALYVLFMLMLAYLVNQLVTFGLIATNSAMSQEIGYGDRICDPLNDTIIEKYLEHTGQTNITGHQLCQQDSALYCDRGFAWQNQTLCYWRYLGKGLEYQLLAGPLYIVLFSISGVPMGLAAELNNVNRKVFLCACIMLWSIMTIFGAVCTEYWHLAITRLMVGIASAGCVPFCAGIITDYFEQSARGAALGFYNWGIYVGYSLTFTLTLAAANINWQSVYYIAGAPGIVLSLIILITVKEPRRGAKGGDKAITALDQLAGTCDKTKAAFRTFADPALLLLCLGGAIRNGAGIVWAYNIIIFFDEYHPGTQTSRWMTWIPLVFGSLGAFGGGVLSDRLSKTKGITGRLIVLIGCLVLSAPFNVGTLWAPMPWPFICHIPAYLIGEMWIGVCVAVVIDLVPVDLTTSSVAVYFFIIQIIGGNMNLLVPPLEQVVGLRYALLIMFPGMYILGAIFMVFVLLIVLHRNRKQHSMVPSSEQKEGDESEEDESLSPSEPLHKACSKEEGLQEVVQI